LDVETISPWPFPVCDRNQSQSESHFFLLDPAAVNDDGDGDNDAATAPPRRSSSSDFDYSLPLCPSSSNPPKAVNDLAFWLRCLPDWTGIWTLGEG